METRERLLVATIELFGAKGYQGASLVEVASSARATIGSLYHFFPGGKVALAAEALRTSGAPYQGLFDLVAAGADGTAPATVSAFFDGAADALEETESSSSAPSARWHGRWPASTTSSEPLQAGSSATGSST